MGFPEQITFTECKFSIEEVLELLKQTDYIFIIGLIFC